MVPIGDQLDVDVVPGERHGGEARRVLVHAGHRIEQVRRRARAGVIAGPRLVSRRDRMAERGDDAVLGEPTDQIDCAGRLGRDRRDAEAAEPELQVLERRLRRGLHERRVLRAHALGRDERPLEVEAERRRPVVRRGGQPGADPFREGAQLCQRRGHGGGQEGSDAAPEQRPGHAVEGGLGAHRVVAAPAVDVDVHEAGHDPRAAGGGRIHFHGRDPAVL